MIDPDSCIQRVFAGLLHDDPDGGFLSGLWEMARRPEAVTPPADCGRLTGAKARSEVVFGRSFLPPKAFLVWLATHPQGMRIPGKHAFSMEEMSAMGACKLLLEQWGLPCHDDWHAYETLADVDCYFEIDKIVLFVQANPTETISPSTKCLCGRLGLWRDVEVAGDLAKGRDFGVILAVRFDDDGERGVKNATEYLAASYPHLSTDQRTELARHFLGFVTWPQIVRRFGLNVRL